MYLDAQSYGLNDVFFLYNVLSPRYFAIATKTTKSVMQDVKMKGYCEHPDDSIINKIERQWEFDRKRN